jgi:hypothetical protein
MIEIDASSERQSRCSTRSLSHSIANQPIRGLSWSGEQGFPHLARDAHDPTISANRRAFSRRGAVSSGHAMTDRPPRANAIGPYRIVARVWAPGGMGEVFKAWESAARAPRSRSSLLHPRDGGRCPIGSAGWSPKAAPPARSLIPTSSRVLTPTSMAASYIPRFRHAWKGSTWRDELSRGPSVPSLTRGLLEISR